MLETGTRNLEVERNTTVDQRLDGALESTTRWLLAHFQRDAHGGYWHGELEADTTLESDYILFLYFLDRTKYADKIQRLALTVIEEQLSDGAWRIHPRGPGEVSASVKAYFALRLAGYAPEEPFMIRARDAILRLGGIERTNSFTKIYLSFLKQLPWDRIPVIPPEVILLPRFFYINIYEMSYWTRVILIPLSILYAQRPHRFVEVDFNLDELFVSSHPGLTLPPLEGYALERERSKRLISWRTFFLLADRFLKIVEKSPVNPLRKLALRKAEEWITARSGSSDGLGAIFPSMVNTVMALRTLGRDESHPVIAHTVKKLEELEVHGEDGKIRLQPCLSPVWDTALALNALREAGVPAGTPELVEAGRWLLSKEVRLPGDWLLRRPGIEPSGWYFQFANEFYPDIDDSAAVILALDRLDPAQVEGLEASLRRALPWILGLQASNGGWAAFDADVERQALTHVPYADHNAMLDPACADITGRVLEMLGRFTSLRGHPSVRKAIERGVAFLRAEQKPDGSWYGRWGVNYIYGTWQALKGLLAVGEDRNAPYIRKAVAWLKSVQHPDGGWGETCSTYPHPELKGQGKSTASQTAWAVMGLCAAGELDSPEVERGIAFLLDTQEPDGSWTEDEWTGTGFPEVFYLKYHYYRIYFPLFALGYYKNLRSGTQPTRGLSRVDLGARPSGTVASPEKGVPLGASRN